MWNYRFKTLIVLQFRHTTVLRFRHTTVLQFRHTTVLQFRHTTVLRFRHTTVLQFRHTTVLRFRHTTVLQFRHTTVLRFRHTPHGPKTSFLTAVSEWSSPSPASANTKSHTEGHNTFPLRAGPVNSMQLHHIYMLREQLCGIWGFGGSFVKEWGTAVWLS